MLQDGFDLQCAMWSFFSHYPVERKAPPGNYYCAKTKLAKHGNHLWSGTILFWSAPTNGQPIQAVYNWDQNHICKVNPTAAAPCLFVIFMTGPYVFFPSVFGRNRERATAGLQKDAANDPRDGRENGLCPWVQQEIGCFRDALTHFPRLCILVLKETLILHYPRLGF